MPKEWARRGSSDSAELHEAASGGLSAGLEGAAQGGSDVVETISHFQYAPTAFALFPVLASLVVGSDLTDLMLLFLVAIYLHNCVTVPADYYRHSARRFTSLDTSRCSETQLQALAKQKTVELQAFFGLIVGPLLGAALLHYVRTIMGRPANGLISNFNITIFVLAAEMRPIKIAHKYLNARSDHLHATLQDVPASRYDELSDSLAEIRQELTRVKYQLEVSESSAQDTKLRQKKTLSGDDVDELDVLKTSLRHFERQSAQDRKVFRSQMQELNKRLEQFGASSARVHDQTQSMPETSPYPSVLTLPFRLCYRCWLLFTFPVRMLQHGIA